MPQMIRFLGDMPLEWAFLHEGDRLWVVNVTGQHLMPTLRPTLYRTLDDAIKATAGMTGCDRVFYRRECDNSAGEPVISCRTGQGGSDNIVATLEPMYLAFTMPTTARVPRGWDKVEG